MVGSDMATVTRKSDEPSRGPAPTAAYAQVYSPHSDDNDICMDDAENNPSGPDGPLGDQKPGRPLGPGLTSRILKGLLWLTALSS